MIRTVHSDGTVTARHWPANGAIAIRSIGMDGDDRLLLGAIHNEVKYTMWTLADLEASCLIVDKVDSPYRPRGASLQ